uniref:Uncharacterized protein n=1 Tax=Rhizophora mucronata TaxID=61149 RepID=A0A2P2QX25_RHIMU
MTLRHPKKTRRVHHKTGLNSCMIQDRADFLKLGNAHITKQ